MSEKVVHSREELIAQRDKIIEELQGRWEPQRDASLLKKGVIQRGIRISFWMFITLSILMFCLRFFDAFANGVSSTSVLVDDGKPKAVELVLVIIGCSVAAGALISGLMYLATFSHRKTGPVIVEGTILRKE